jgi:hypothetical protein
MSNLEKNLRNLRNLRNLDIYKIKSYIIQILQLIIIFLYFKIVHYNYAIDSITNYLCIQTFMRIIE